MQTHPATGIILSASALLMQKPAPPVANQNRTFCCNRQENNTAHVRLVNMIFRPCVSCAEANRLDSSSLLADTLFSLT